MVSSLRYVIATSLVLTFAAVTGCGRYLPPVSPEVLVPQTVETLRAVYNPDNSVTLSWVGPSSDKRGKKLKELEGYQIERSLSGGSSALTDAPTERLFEQVAFIPDTYYEALRKQQQDALERGDIVRKVKLDDSLKSYSYTIKKIPQGISFYRVFAVNAEGGDGDFEKVVQVTNDSNTRTVAVVSQGRENRS
jgi:hypothetical protein